MPLPNTAVLPHKGLHKVLAQPESNCQAPEESSRSSSHNRCAADLLVAWQLEAIAPGGDGAVPVPQQAPPAEPAIKGRQVVPHTVVAVLDIHNDDLQADWRSVMQQRWQATMLCRQSGGVLGAKWPQITMASSTFATHADAHFRRD